MNTSKIIELKGKHSQLLIECTTFAEILHWGKAIDANSTQSFIALERPVPYGRLDKDVAMTLSPELGRGVFSSPGLEGHRDGRDWAPVFELAEVTQVQNQVQLVGIDKKAGLCLCTEIELDPNDVLKIRHRLTNQGQGQYLVNRLANTLPLPARACELLTYQGRWVHEFQTQRQPLIQGGYQQENRRGRTSHEHYPALIAGSAHFGEMQGEVWGFHFAWSGNHRLRTDVKTDGRRFFQAEIIYLPGELVLAEGESLTTPWLYASYSDSGLNGMSQQFHAHVRESILPDGFAKKTRPIHLNTWEGIYFEHDPNYIMEMATQAAAMGVERFIIDDGWFKGRNNDKAGLGDWFLAEDKYPEGLTPIISHVNRLGMEFGLWFEPEMINQDSDLFRAHPDWLLAVEGYEQPTGRNQYVIDLQNEQAFNYLYSRLDAFLTEYNIGYIKWDMNREIVQPGHHGKAAAMQQTLAYYALVDKVRAKHPEVEIESCAAGGGRIDFEVLKRTHRFWTSDNNDALERQHIQRGMSYFFPPEVMGCHIGAAYCHSTRRRHSIGFRGLTALFGHMGIELDPVKETESEKRGFEHYIKLHKSLRDLLHSGTNWRIPTDDKAHQVLAVVTKDKSEAVIQVAQLSMPTHALSGHLRIPGLDPKALYQVNLLDKPDNFNDIVNCQPAWTFEGCTLSGEWCETIGLTMPILDAESAILIGLKRLD